MRDAKRSPATVILALLAVLPLLYGSAYLLLAERWFVNPGGVWVEYRAGGDLAEKLFAPAHWLDRKVRPQYWDYMTLRDDVQYFPALPLSDNAATQEYKDEEERRLRY